MKHSTRRWLSMLLAVVMVLSMVPVTAMAEEALAPADGWTVMHETDAYTINSENSVTIEARYGDFVDDANNTEPESYWVMDAPEGDFELTVKVSGGMTANYQKAGVMVYLDEHTVASATRRYHTGLGNNVFGLFQHQPWTDNQWGESAVADPKPNEDAWLKLVRKGTEFTGFYSFDGETWVDMGSDAFPSLTNEKLTDDKDLKVGVFAVTGNTDDNLSVTFTDFAIDGEIIPFAVDAGEIPAREIKLPAAVTLARGEVRKLDFQVIPDYTTDELVWTSDNESVATVKDGVVTAHSVGTANITVEAPECGAACAVTVIAGDDDGLVQYLCEKPWVDTYMTTCSTGWGGLGVHTGVINPNNGNPDGGAFIKIGGKTYDHGLAAHAPSRMVFDIENMGVMAFRATVGIHNDRAKATAGFTVMADGEVLFYTELKGGETADVNVVVPADAKELILIGDDGGDSNDSDHTTWANPRLILDPMVQNTLRKLELTAPDFLWIGETGEASVKAWMVNGAEVTDGKITFSSSDEDVLTVAADGTITAKTTGTAIVTAEMTVEGVTRSAESYVTVGDKNGERAWEFASPDGNVEVSLSLQGNNELHYSVTKGGETVVGDSVIGIRTSLGDFSNGLVMIEKSLTEVNDTYTMLSGKATEIVNHYNEQVLTFAKADATFTVYFRAYADGYAFRYTVAKADGSEGDLTVNGETSTFALPAGSHVWAQPDNRGDGVFNHENTFSEIAIENVNVPESMPMLNKAENGLWTLITEANNYSDSLYVGSYLNPEGDGVFRVAIPRQQQKEMGTYDVSTTYPFTSPWRLAISGDLGTIVESTMVTNVSDDPYIDQDWSWVQPGFTAWTWLVGGKSIQYNYEAIKQYVDFASEMGWKYFIMDEGWQPASSVAGKRYSGYYEWFDELVEYADAKGVKLIAWILAHDLDTPQELEVLEEYADKGIAGIKVDFFDSDGQETIELYKSIYEKCAEEHLIINAHGANKPTGESRTYPNVINREAVRGQEYGSISTDQTTVWAFTRGVVGPMDITPKIYGSGTTTGQQAAMNILFESGMPCMASSIADYKSSPALELLRNMPSVWDEIHFIDGYPGQFTTLARRSGEMWYAASITNSQARDAVIALDFLSEGVDYIASIYRDGASARDMIVESEYVTSESVLTIPMTANGGCSVKLIPLDDAVSSIEMEDEIVLEQGGTAELEYTVTAEEGADTSVSFTVSDTSVATVADGVITAVGVGTATVTVTSVANPSVSATCILRVTGEKYGAIGQWEIDNPNAANGTVIYEDNANKITLPTISGDVDHSGNAQNVWIMEAPEGDWEITAQVTHAQLSENYQKVGVIAWHDNSHVVSMNRRYHQYLGNNVFGMATYHHETSSYDEPSVADPDPDAPAWLKLEKKGNTFTGFYSLDGETWTKVGEITSAVVGESENLKIGVFAASGSPVVTAIPVDVENFTLDNEVIPFSGLLTEGKVTLVEEVAPITLENAGDPIELPETVKVYTDLGTAFDAKVTWDTSSVGTEAGEYTVTGTLTAQEGMDPNGVTVSTTVTVLHQHTLIHIDAVEPGCHYNGNIEYWYCTECEMFWQDEALTQITNSKRVILPATGSENVEHVAAKEPTHTENGNIEYWYCPDCEQYWQDEALTQLTNSKNVILPAEGCLAAAFTDVNLDAWYHEPIDFVLANGMMTGDKEGTFRPDVNISRAQVAQILYNMAEDKAYEASKTFSDVKDGQWFYDAVMWAAANGFVLGDDGADTFRPDAPITRQELVVIIWRYMGKNAPANAELTFADAAEAASWAVEPIAWATENGFVNGMGDNKFAPKANASRAQMTQILMNIFGK